MVKDVVNKMPDKIASGEFKPTEYREKVNWKGIGGLVGVGSGFFTFCATMAGAIECPVVVGLAVAGVSIYYGVTAMAEAM